MKKLFALFATAAMIFTVGCGDNGEDVNPDKPNQGQDLPYETLYLSVNNEDSQVQHIWNNSDQISVFNKTDGNECWKFKANTDNQGSFYKISGTIGTKINKVIALYPYDSNCAVSGNMISTSIPATQTYRADSFGEGGSIMVAVSDDDNLSFNNVFGWIKLSLTDDKERKVRSIVLTGNNGEILAGNTIIDASTQKVYMEGNSTSSITLDCGEGVQLSKTAATYFYIALAPQVFAKGVSVDIKTTNGTSLKNSYEEPFTITRNHMQSIKAGNLQSANNMIFYTTTDGKSVIMGTTEGFGANFISNTYENGQGIIRFDRNITSIPNAAFRNCTGLESITIPESVTLIKEEAFGNCSSLTSINIPDSVTSIWRGVFLGCSSLTSITIPSSVTSIGSSVFGGCSSLTNITIPDRVTSIEVGTFGNCSSLTSITIPDSVTKIGAYAFSHCSSLTNITIPDRVTSIEVGTFGNCSSLISVYCKPKTPPTFGGYVFDYISSSAKIYVPTASVDAYKKANGWSSYASMITGYDF